MALVAPDLGRVIVRALRRLLGQLQKRKFELGMSAPVEASELDKWLSAATKDPAQRAILSLDSRLRARLAAAVVSGTAISYRAALLLTLLGCPPSRIRGRDGRIIAPGRGGVRILSLDGGGTRALVTIEMLKGLERETGRRVHEMFDVVAGTSTGGILAAGIQERLPIEDIEELYLELAAQIFKKPRLKGVQLALTGATYQASRLEALLKQTLAQLPKLENAPDAASDSLSMLERRALQELACASANATWYTHMHNRAASSAAKHANAAGPGPSTSAPSLEPAAAAAAAAAAVAAAPPVPSPPPLHLLIVACLTSRAPVVPYLFRNYEYPATSLTDIGASPSRSPTRRLGANSHSEGSSAVPLWQALRATTAAPSFFPAARVDHDVATSHAAGTEAAAALAAAEAAEALATAAAAAVPDAGASVPGSSSSSSSTSTSSSSSSTTTGTGSYTGSSIPHASAPASRSLVFQDGALLANNPAALALHEARLLYPDTPIALLASFGTGQFISMERSEREVGSISSTVQTLVGAATRTEEVHQMLSDMLPILHVPYFRFNPAIPRYSLDETSLPKLRELQAIGREHVSSGPGKEDCAALAQLLLGGGPQRLGLRAWPAKIASFVARFAQMRVGSRLRSRI